MKKILIDEQKGISALVEDNKIVSYEFDEKKSSKEDSLKWIEAHAEMIELMLEGKNFNVDLSRDDVGLVDVKPVTKQLDFEVKNFNEETRSFSAIASTEAVDRDGDILSAKGWILKNFRKNPVLLWGHNASMLPIGKALNIKVENGIMNFTPTFTPKGMNPFADQVFDMFKSGFLKAFSVRFDPVEAEPIFDDKDNDSQFRRVIGRKFTKMELLEISAVNIPANPQALMSRDFQSMVLKGYKLDKCSNFDIADVEELYKEEIKINEDKTNQANIKLMETKGENWNKSVDEIIEKQGAVLSKKNRDLVVKAKDALQAILDASDKEDDDKSFDDLVTELKDEIDEMTENEQIKELKKKVEELESGITASK